MSKIISILLIIFIFHLSPLFPIALAIQACNAVGITYSPPAFPPNPSDITLNFKINSANVLQNLMGKEVQLVVPHWFWADYYSAGKTVTGDSFPLTVGPRRIFTEVDPLSTGYHTAVLAWKPDPKKDFTALCSDIVYTIGDPKTCVIDPNLKSEIPPDTLITIRFSGQPKEQYSLYHTYNTAIPSLKQATTNDQDQGEFKDVKIPGTSGDTVDLIIAHDRTGRHRPYCSKRITIKLGAEQPGPPGTEPVPTAAPGTGVGPGGQPIKPAGPKAVSGGIPCGVGDSGIQTAIGCIHTSPAEFAKDILKFAIGIGGGLAFLMMLLGAFQMLTSAGNPDSLKAGQDRLTSAVIGLLFVIFAVLFLQIIGANILGLPDFKP